MSFAKDSKIEIISNEIDDADCGQAFISGLLHACGAITKNSDGIKAELVTDFREIFDYLNKLVEKLYGETLHLEISDDYIINKTTY